MGYDLHIKRKDNWDDYEEQSSISLDEWLAYVQSDEELELLNPISQSHTLGAESNRESILYFNWKNHPTKHGDDTPCFDYWRGEISAKYPDDDTIKKMISIAEYFQGRVQGDDGEFYDENYFLKRSTSDMVRYGARRPWWKLW